MHMARGSCSCSIEPPNHKVSLHTRLPESEATAAFESAACCQCHEFEAALLGLALCKNPCLDEGGSGGRPADCNCDCCTPTAGRLDGCDDDDERENEGGAPDAKDCPESAVIAGEDAGCMRGEAETGSTGAVKGCGSRIRDGWQGAYNKRERGIAAAVKCCTFCHSLRGSIDCKSGLGTGFSSGLIAGEGVPLKSKDTYDVTCAFSFSECEQNAAATLTS
jgi:hypothetical protein